MVVRGDTILEKPEALTGPVVGSSAMMGTRLVIGVMVRDGPVTSHDRQRKKERKKEREREREREKGRTRGLLGVWSFSLLGRTVVTSCVPDPELTTMFRFEGPCGWSGVSLQLEVGPFKSLQDGTCRPGEHGEHTVTTNDLPSGSSLSRSLLITARVGELYKKHNWIPWSVLRVSI